MNKALEPFLTGQVGITPRALAVRHPAVPTLLIAEAIEVLDSK